MFLSAIVHLGLFGKSEGFGWWSCVHLQGIVGWSCTCHRQILGRLENRRFPLIFYEKSTIFQVTITLRLLGRFLKIWMFWAALIMYFINLMHFCDNGRLFCDNTRRFGDKGRLWVIRLPWVNHEFSNPIDWPRLATVGPILEILDVLNRIVCVRSNFSTICVIFSAPTVLR